MSAETDGTVSVDPLRALALLAALALTASYVSVLYDIANVVGYVDTLVPVVLGALALGTVVGRTLRVSSGVGVGAALLVGGYGGYLLAVPDGWLLVTSLGQVVRDTLALLTGLSALRMTKVGIWAVGFAPGPVFLSWYLAVRRRYVASAVVGATALSVFVLTGDATTAQTLVGVVGAAALVGLSDLDRADGGVRQVDALAVVLAAMVVLSVTLTVVPGGQAQPLFPGGGGSGTVEGSLVAADERIAVQGSTSLSPKVSFVVTSDEAAYWRAGAYDRYTGDAWVRTGEPDRYGGALASPPGESRQVTQTFEAKRTIDTMPAAWKPTQVRGDAGEHALVTSMGGLQPRGGLAAGDVYTVESSVPTASADDLRAAGTDYPPGVAERYTQLPASTPERVAERTDRITQGTDDPYRQAALIERWLENEKEYSLDVDRPEGDIADEFLFEMEAGYCTYYATTMVTMLRTQGVPARFVVGYSPGQRVAEDQWVVRGLNSHAWVEVYFPDVGWVAFDPTPGGPRDDVRETELDAARAQNVSGVDAAGSEDGEWTPTPAEDQQEGRVPGGDQTPARGQIQEPDAVDGAGPDTTSYTFDTPTGESIDESEPEHGYLGWLPSTQEIGFGLVVFVGVAAGAHRAGATGRARTAAAMRWQGRRRTPSEDAERAFRRLSLLLERRYRTRRDGETVRSYLDTLELHGVDERARRVAAIRERSRYGDEVSRAEIDEAVALVDELVAEATPLLGRLRGR